MGFTDPVLEAAALAAVGMGDRISLHTADPGITGANEVTGGNPAYARKATTWGGGVEDGAVSGSLVTFDVPPGTYTHFGVWAGTGEFRWGLPLPSPVTIDPQGTVDVTPTLDVNPAA